MRRWIGVLLVLIVLGLAGCEADDDLYLRVAGGIHPVGSVDGGDADINSG